MDNQQGMEARRQSVPAPVMNLLSRRRRAEAAQDPHLQCNPEWLIQCSLLKWLWDSSLGCRLRSSFLGRQLGSSKLGLWLDSHCPTLTTLLLLKVVLWLALVWILSDLHMGLPCFLLTLTYWLYEGPLSRAVDWIRTRCQNRALPRPGASTDNPRRGLSPRGAIPSVMSRDM